MHELIMTNDSVANQSQIDSEGSRTESAGLGTDENRRDGTCVFLWRTAKIIYSEVCVSLEDIA
jgi:hypothetical protein